MDLRTLRHTALAATLLFAAPPRGQSAAPAAPALAVVWPDGKMPGNASNEAERDMPARGDNVQRITHISRPTLTYFPAPQKEAPGAAVIICPGGGYNYVVFDKEGSEVAAWLNSEGITALVLKYRTPNNRDGAMQDLQRAVSLVRSKSADWNIDPKRVGLLGFSAGGNLAAKASTRFDERTYPAIDAVDQQSCRPDFAVLVYPAYLDKDGRVSPDLNLQANIPPTLIVHTEDDHSFVTGSKAYHAALERANIANHQFLLYPTGGHGYGLRGKGDAKDWPKASLEWLRKIGIANPGK